MPGRKSGESVTSQSQRNGDEAQSSPQTQSKNEKPILLSVDDLAVPRSMVARLSKGVLPANAQIQRDALVALAKSATVFVNYLSNTANDRAILYGKKTIQPRDVFESLNEIEFSSFLNRCEQETEKYNQIQCDKRNTYRRRVKEERHKNSDDGDVKSNGEEATDEPLNGVHEEAETNGAAKPSGTTKERDGAPAAKKIRLSQNGEAAHVGGDNGDETIDENEEDEGFEDQQDENEEDDEVEDAEDDERVGEQHEETDEEEEPFYDADETPLGPEDDEEGSQTD